jgi:hypothetical protein
VVNSQQELLDQVRALREQLSEEKAAREQVQKERDEAVAAVRFPLRFTLSVSLLTLGSS